MHSLLRRSILIILLIGGTTNSGCAASQTPLYTGTIYSRAEIASTRPLETGKASWYGPGFHGRRTSSGEQFNQNALTAAHKSLPFGSIVEVRDVKTNNVVRVRINDRGPFIRGRIIDLSKEAARQLGITNKGIATIELRIIRG